METIISLWFTKRLTSGISLVLENPHFLVSEWLQKQIKPFIHLVAKQRRVQYKQIKLTKLCLLLLFLKSQVSSNKLTFTPPSHLLDLRTYCFRHSSPLGPFSHKDEEESDDSMKKPKVLCPENLERKEWAKLDLLDKVSS